MINFKSTKEIVEAFHNFGLKILLSLEAFSFVTNIMIKKIFVEIVVVVVLCSLCIQSLERKKCHCAKTLRRYLFFRRFVHTFFIVARNSGDFFRLLFVVMSLEAYFCCFSFDNAFFGGSRGKKVVHVILVLFIQTLKKL